MKVGRAALDDEAIRLIEQLNPDVEFDWPRILKGQGQPQTEPRLPPDVRRQRQDGRRQQGRAQGTQPSRPVSAEAPPPQVPAMEPPAGPADVPETAAHTAPVEVPPEFVARVPDETSIPAHAKLGAEGVQRLRTRYAEILQRIPERTADPVRREELRVQAERLNPDSWSSDEAVAQALEQYESVFASLREVVGQKRRRRRRNNRPRSGADARADETDASASTTETDDGGSANESRDDEGGGEDEGSGSPSSESES